MPKKPTPFDPIRYIPIVVLAVSIIGSYFKLSNGIANAKDAIDEINNKKLTALEFVQTKLTQDTSTIQVNQAVQNAKLDIIVEVLKELKAKK